ncbi:MAG: aminomethyl-transferring glycine dehydrogenase subunit GcvPA [Eubacteriales bacterium]|jgi:glycine dehydrogenase subunit 1
MYVPQTSDDRRAMLDAIGVKDIRSLYDSVPDSIYLNRPLDLPKGRPEYAVSRMMEAYAENNRRYRAILRGAGAYDRYTPAIVRRVAAKEDFVTAYTPYQAEVSQGVLQSIFEYQTMICALTGMDVSNASVYDGATAAAEACAMCRERGKTGVLISESVHPQVREVVATYVESATGERPTLIPTVGGMTDADALSKLLSTETACVLTQQPNFYGLIEDAEKLADLAHSAGSRYIMSVDPTSLGVMKTPREYGADIAVGDGQPLGLGLSFGGPSLGFMTCVSSLTRRLPGRIVGETVDNEGRRCYVLTLQAREQHIRREKAQSNICSNQALCALTASVYLASMGAEGLRRAACLSMTGARTLLRLLTEIPGITRAFPGEFFDEFVTFVPDSGRISDILEKNNILGGLPLTIDDKPAILWCVTETVSEDVLHRTAQLVRKAVEG